VFRVQGLGFRVQDAGFRMQGKGFMAEAYESEDGMESRAEDSG
jgi:hypothetical protein